MRKINFIFAIILISLLFLSIASIAFSQNIKKTFELPEFKSISVNSNYYVYVKQSNKQEVIADAPQDVMELTTIVVDNGVLMINIEKKADTGSKSVWAKLDNIKLSETLKIHISVKNITDLQVNGGGRIISENSLAADYLTLSVAGSGLIDVDIKGNTVKTDISGSGNITLKGYATTNTITDSGSGSLNAFACEVETAKVKIAGSGSAEINVTQNLDALVLGAGSVKVKGNTKTVTKKVYGSGSVDRAY